MPNIKEKSTFREVGETLIKAIVAVGILGLIGNMLNRERLASIKKVIFRK